MAQYVYFFGGGKADGNKEMKDTLGGKGAGLAEMTNAGLPVPPGFTISTEVCRIFYENKGKLSEDIQQQIKEALAKRLGKFKLKIEKIRRQTLCQVNILSTDQGLLPVLVP